MSTNRSHPEGPGELLKIGDLARRTGKSVRALHLYEELGLLRPASRTSGGFRLFDEESPRRIHWITLLQEMGMSLPQIRGMLDQWWGNELGPEAMSELRRVFEEKLDEARARVSKYQMLAVELERSLKYIETCHTCAPAPHVGMCASCTRDHGMEEQPVLVAGLHVSSPRRGDRPDLVQLSDPLATDQEDPAR